MDSSIVIKVRDFNFFYGKAQVIFDINMDVPKKQITALIGPSGCGKSTFLRSLNRMNDLIEGTRQTGQIFYQDQLIHTYPVIELRKNIGMVFQKPNPFPFSVFDNVAFGPRIHGIKKRKYLEEIVEKSLRQAALWKEVKDKLNQSAHSLSGGQQQRLCIARTIAINPKVILMDEPTSALDPASTAHIENLLQTLSVDYTTIIVTHNMQQAARISTQTAFFLNGYLEDYGMTSDIFVNPTKQTTEDYISGRFG